MAGSGRALVASLLVAALTGAGCSGLWKPSSRYFERGEASWYGPGFHGKTTANGEIYDMNAMTAAHKKLPFDTVVEVLNRDNGRRVRVRINDRGPFVRGRIIDLSRAAAERIGMIGPGTARVEVTIVQAKGEVASQRYVIQVAAFESVEAANELAATLRRDYDRVHISLVDGVHRVRVGNFKKQKRAERWARDLRQSYPDAFVTTEFS